ncbi:MAG: hypothetical protein B6D62_03950 [Candidatus Cloacimonas sp. 4484_275]|nr:MAG: hypothetical protein B6D62_03950 [Candidatus Cloacimonas sp. 4484_275]
MLRRNFLFIIFLICLTNLFAQWNDDATSNTVISDLNGPQAIPKIGTHEDGDSYVGWFSNDNGNYDVRLQRFDANGNEQWPHNGILISNHEAMSWLTDWDLKVDYDDYAILAFQDIRTGNNNVFVYRISPDGEFVWGADGIQLSDSEAFDVSPKIAVTEANNIIIVWQADSVIIMQKISPEGELLWGENGITLSGENTYSWPQPIAVGEDDIILKFYEDSGPVWAPVRHILAQRFDADGNPVWNENTVISDAGGISAWTQLLSGVPDDNDGFFIVWHDDRDANNLADSFIQHVTADGETTFQDNGIPITTQSGYNHFYPRVSYIPETEEIYIFWNEMDGNQNLRGIFGQKMNLSGDRLWGDTGIAFVSLSETNVLPIAVRKSETDVVVFFTEYQNSLASILKAMRINGDGNYIWEAEQISMSSLSSEKMHFDVNRFNNDQWIAVWEDLRNDDGDIYGQNIHLNGELGGGSLAENYQINSDDNLFPKRRHQKRTDGN